MNEKQKEFLAQSGINLTDGLAYFSENESEFSHARERCSQRCERLKNLVVH